MWTKKGLGEGMLVGTYSIEVHYSSLQMQDSEIGTSSLFSLNHEWREYYFMVMVF